ncbi:putative calmodulin [Cladochytrium replicatum]|nr:putative calmodulin [Cladochytrium replicatum]
MPLSAEQQQMADETFALFDRDGNGEIDAKELGRLLQRMGQNPADAAKLLGQDDANRDGKINKAEYFQIFARVMGAPLELSKDSLLQMFKSYDKNGDGELTVEEVRKLILGLTSDKRISTELVDELLANADKSGNGKLNIEEFATFAAQNLKL